MMKTEKSKLLKSLESKVVAQSPLIIHETVIDASFFLYLQMNLPTTFGHIAKVLLTKIMTSMGDIIHYVTDKWINPSIKDNERDSRCSYNSSYEIKGANQKRPSNWIDALKNPIFKIAFNKFLVEAWKDNSLSDIYQGKILYANCGDVCYKFSVHNGNVIRTEEPRLFSNHEEADSRMFHHVAFSTRSTSETINIVVRTVDADCLIIALGCFKRLREMGSVNLWLEVGLETKNTLRYISINQIYDRIGEALALSLPAFHAFFGCDYSAAFSRRGKIKPFKLLENDIETQRVFAKFGETDLDLDSVDESVAILEKFVCNVYGKRRLCSVDDVRLQIFIDRYKQKKLNQSITCVKKFDGTSIPPCSKVLRQKMRQTIFITKRWFSSVNAFEPSLSPLNHGWTLEDGKYIINWYNGESALKSLDIVLKESGDLEDDENEDNFYREFDGDSDDEDEQNDYEI